MPGRDHGGEIWSRFLYNIVIRAPGNPPGMEERVRKAQASGRGDRVILSLDTSWMWIGAWLGAVWLGALPVAMPSPGPLGSVERYRLRLDAVMRKLDARYVLVPAGSLAAELTASHKEPLVGKVIAARPFHVADANAPTT